MTREQLFWAKVNKEGPNGCWLWTSPPANDGYGQFWVGAGKSPMLAHRFSYELHNGPITDEMTVDHLCYVRLCVNPAHLEVVPRGENVQRAFVRRRARQTERENMNTPVHSAEYVRSLQAEIGITWVATEQLGCHTKSPEVCHHLRLGMPADQALVEEGFVECADCGSVLRFSVPPVARDQHERIVNELRAELAREEDQAVRIIAMREETIIRLSAEIDRLRAELAAAVELLDKARNDTETRQTPHWVAYRDRAEKAEAAITRVRAMCVRSGYMEHEYGRCAVEDVLRALDSAE